MRMKLENISKQYFRKTGSANYFYAVNPVDLEIEEGKMIVLMGRSGSGKTTLLNMMSGLLAPTGGKVWMDDMDLYSLDDRSLSRLRRQRIGVVPQGRSAVDTLTLLENILLPARLYHLPLPLQTAEVWMEKLNITHLSDAYPSELSGGELRRMAIVRALTQDPDFLFADEPTGDLDDENTGLVLSVLHDFAHKQKRTVFVVTHENEALKYADTIYKMDNGQMTCLHTPGSVNWYMKKKVDT